MKNVSVIQAHIRGISPLLMHNSRLADPLDEATKRLKEVTSKRKKSDDDHLSIRHLEFMGSIYYRPEIGVYLPADSIMATLQAGAKFDKLGKAFKSTVFVEDDVPLIYDGPKEPEKLYEKRFYDVRSVCVNMARTMRCRPRFNNWEAKFEVTLLPGAGLNHTDVQSALEQAGIMSGLGDFRPRFGRFEVVDFAVK